MVKIKIGKNNIVVKVNLKKFLVACLIFSLVIGWVFSGWPQVLDFEVGEQEIVFPPKIQEARAAIAVTATSTGTVSGTNLTFSHTIPVSGENYLLMVGVATDGASGITAITYNSEAMSLVDSRLEGGGGKTKVYLYSLATTTTDGNPHDVSIDFDASESALGGGVSFSGVDQTAPLDTPAQNGSKANSGSVGVTANSTDDMVIAVSSLNAGASITYGSSGETGWYNILTGAHAHAAQTAAGIDGTVTMNQTHSGSQDWAMIGVAINMASLPNDPPVVEAVSLTPSPITLTDNTTTTVTCTSTISDSGGGDTIVSATATIYRSGVTESCSADDNNCYPNITPFASSTSGNNFYATFTQDLWFHAEPTDGTAPNYSGEWWECYVIAEDSGALTDTATGSAELNSLSALIITTSINYGSLAPGASTTVSVTTTATTTGNIAIDVKIRGTDLATSTFTIPGQQQKYATSIVAWSDGAAIVMATTSQSYKTLELESLKPVQNNPIQATATDNIFWGILIPAGQDLATYFGTTTVAATQD